MVDVGFYPTEEQRKIADKKADELIDVLSDIKDIRMKAFILFSLIQSFKDVSGIDLYKSFYVETEEERYK